MCSLLSTGCWPKPLPPKTVEVPASSVGCGDAFILEHSDLYAENIRLKAALKLCQEKH